MSVFRGLPLITLTKVYIAIALAIAAALSPAALSFVPLLLLAGYLYLWRWRPAPVVNLMAAYFIFFAIALLFSVRAGPLLSPVIALPGLFLVHERLEETAESAACREHTGLRRPTDTSIALAAITALVFLISSLLGNTSLLLVSLAGIAYLAALGTIALRKLPVKPVEETSLQHRILAGSKADVNAKLAVRTSIGGNIFLKSPYEWMKVSPNRISLKGEELTISLSFSPELSGPSVVEIQGQATDRWGLFSVNFEIEPLRLFVIPRARYAEWLARKYMAGSKPGILPMVSNVAALKPVYGLRRGIEYYGNRQYQPGDSLKNIDWKHSIKSNELVSKEFAEFHGRSAIVLINLAVGNEEQADKLAYNIIVTALSFARDNIPAALAAYDDQGVRLTTNSLSGQQLVPQATQLAREIVVIPDPRRYLSPPDVLRLKANLGRVQMGESQACQTLAELLRLEYEAISANARLNPATKALAAALARGDKQANVVIISHRNHDAEALAFNTFELGRRGNAVIAI